MEVALDLSLDGESRQSVSIVALGIDSSKSFKGKYGDDLYSIERVKLAYYPSLEVIEVSIHEYTSFRDHISLTGLFGGYILGNLYENSRLNIVSEDIRECTALHSMYICKTNLPEVDNRTYFICPKDNENKLYELCACVYDLESGDYFYKVGAPTFVFKDNKFVALYFNFISDKLDFGCRKLVIFGTLNDTKIRLFEHNENKRIKDITIRIPLFESCVHSEIDGDFINYLDLSFLYLKEDKDTVICSSKCRELVLYSGISGVSRIKNLVVGINTKSLHSNHVIADNIYYKSGTENIKFIIKFACACAEFKLRGLGVNDRYINLGHLIDRFSLNKDLDKFMNHVVCGKAISELVSIQSY